ncbi:RNA-binding protein 24-B-like [Dorcoceras hygrometricum]|uniref:RNA-binding protein 24-B-like n=1 Tax=Dorcoceras hygrometricum TaxID=472368 RepID=A0A2Z7BCU7_9LAMI|nr:RNA-binding protein 24-B-like [Dorcoceras hygrometricum]
MAYQQQPAKTGPGGFQYVNSPFGDTTFTKVFVGGLAWETQSETMGRYFEQFGEILEAVVIKDNNSGRSKGYGFVTFREPESARRACADPTPVIDGRRANCNLASLGRHRPAVPFGRFRSPSPYPGGLPAARGSYIGNFGYQQSAPYNAQQGLVYSPYGYAAYSPEYAYSQGFHNPYGSQQNLHIYGAPGATVFQYSQFSQVIPGSHSYTALPGYAIPGHQILQFAGPSVNSLTTNHVPTIPVSYPTGTYIWSS